MDKLTTAGIIFLLSAFCGYASGGDLADCRRRCVHEVVGKSNPLNNYNLGSPRWVNRRLPAPGGTDAGVGGWNNRGNGVHGGNAGKIRGRGSGNDNYGPDLDKLIPWDKLPPPQWAERNFWGNGWNPGNARQNYLERKKWAKTHDCTIRIGPRLYCAPRPVPFTSEEVDALEAAGYLTFPTQTGIDLTNL